MFGFFSQQNASYCSVDNLSSGLERYKDLKRYFSRRLRATYKRFSNIPDHSVVSSDPYFWFTGSLNNNKQTINRIIFSPLAICQYNFSLKPPQIFGHQHVYFVEDDGIYRVDKRGSGKKIYIYLDYPLLENRTF